MPSLIWNCPLRVWYCALLFFTLSICKAQSPATNIALPFELLSIDDGLSQGMVNGIAQDHFGFLWFGTKDGLNRYDGQRFIVYRNIPSDTTSLSDNYILTIFEDSKKRLWIGTSREGLELFNRETETFFHIRLDPGLNSLSNCVIKIQEDQDQNLWVGTYDGLFKLTFDEKADEDGALRFPPEFSIKKYFKNHCNFHIAKSGKIYGTATWLFPFVLHPEKNGNDKVEELAPDKNYWAPAEIVDLLKFTSVVVEDPARKKIYFLYEYSFVEVNQLTGESKIIFRRSREAASLPFNALVDKEGLIWITTSGYMEQFNPRSGNMKIIHAKDYNHTQAARQVRHIFTCRSGIFWIGTMGFGILKYNPAIKKFNTVSGQSIGWMSPSGNGKIIAQTTGALLNEFDPQTGRFYMLESDSLFSAKMNIKLTRPTYSAVKDRDGLYWVNRENLVRFDSESGKFDIISNEGVSGVPLYVAEGGEIWFGSSRAFSHYDPKTKKLAHWRYPFEITNDPYLFIQAIHRDKKGNFWLGTNHGLLFFNPETKQWKNYVKEANNQQSLSNNIIFSILPDPKDPEGILWLGTNGGGLSRMDINTGRFTTYTETDGLPNNVVYGILSDDFARLWLSTNRGISRFDLNSKTFRNFDAPDGLQGNEFNRYAFCKDANGILYFGGMNGLNYFHPEAIHDNAVKPNIVITGLKLRNKKLSFDAEKSPLSKPAYLENRIEIPYSENMITFEFAALEFSAPRKNLYKYRLNGFDQEWISSGNSPSAVYTNLDPGEYTFIVRGTNNDGIWSDQEARLSVIILAPWYFTWWFRLSVILFTVAGSYKLYRYRLDQTIRLQDLRNRIASDLHDEIGSTLSSISLYGEATKKLVSNNKEAMHMLTRINDNTQQMMEAMSDIVWTINTRHDRFDEMMSRMREYAIHAMEIRNCEVHFNDVLEIAQISLDMNQRKNIYLIFKEAVNNAAKYSECKNLYVDFQFKKWGCIIKIRDDGKGFNPELVKKGNGLYNMYKRTEAIKGDLSIHSRPGEGSEVILKVIF